MRSWLFAQQSGPQLSDAELWSNRFGPGISYSEQNPGSLQRYDPPEHTLRRRFLREPFLPKAVEAFQPAVSDLARGGNNPKFGTGEDIAGIVLFAIGLFWEAVGDVQKVGQVRNEKVG